jgi:hypothetical protein
MTEIALWKPIEDVVGLENLPKAKPSMLRGIQLQFLQKPLTRNATNAESCLQQIASACGNSLRDIIEHCLDIDAEPKPQSDAPLGLQKAAGLDLLKKLEHIAEAV